MSFVLRVTIDHVMPSELPILDGSPYLSINLYHVYEEEMGKLVDNGFLLPLMIFLKRPTAVARLPAAAIRCPRCSSTRLATPHHRPDHTSKFPLEVPMKIGSIISETDLFAAAANPPGDHLIYRLAYPSVVWICRDSRRSLPPFRVKTHRSLPGTVMT